MDIAKVKQLREETGVSVALCTKALKETNNDIAKAKLLLIKWGSDIADKKSGKEAHEGIVASYIHHNKRWGATLVLNCETDFVAKNEDFQKLGYELAMQVASMNPKNTEALLKQAYIRDSGKMVGDLIKEYIAKLGENIKVGEFTRLAI